MVNTDSLDSIDVVELPNKDKLVHFSFYFIFSLLWYPYVRKEMTAGFQARLRVFIMAVAYGVLIEICQAIFTKGRSGDVMDALANSAGSAAAILSIWIFKKIKK